MKGGKEIKKELVVKQVDLKDCGACSLLSIIKYYNGFVPLETIRMDTHTTRLGTTAFHLINAAKKYGFDAAGTKIEPDNIKNLILPVIAHIQVENKYNHFVVIYKYNKDKNTITIMDPAKGFQTIDYEKFQETWSKIIIQLFPHSKIPKLKNNRSIINLFLKLVPSQKNILIELISSSMLFTILSIITSFYLKIAINDITYHNLNALKLIIGLFIGLNIIKVIVNYIRDYYENYLNKNIDLEIMIPFFQHLFLLPLNVINNRTTGEIVKRVEEINNIKDLFSKIFVTIFLDLLLGIASAIVLYNINTTLFLLLLVICFIYMLVGLIFNPAIYKKIVANIEYETDFNHEVIEKVDNFLTLKNVHRIDMVNKQIEYKYCRFLKNSFKLNSFFIKVNSLKKFINELGLCIIMSVGCYLILKTKLSLIDLITFNSLLIYMFDPLKNIIDLLPRINYLKASFNKINEFLDLKEEKILDYNERFLNGDIEFNNLTFSYDDYNYICKNFNLTLKKGTKVMLKGHSGCGKSTICKLLYRLYDISSGCIKIDGINILDYNLNTIRNNITYLAQKEDIFTDTIYKNIVLDRNVSVQKFKMISELCHLEDIVLKKPLRYETVIGNNLTSLSGGEKQRILLARALLKKSSIIILDESLSEVEETLERIIMEDLFVKFSDKTIIYISHRGNEDLFDQVIDFEEYNESLL